MKPHSSYKETLEEQKLLKPTTSASTIAKPATQLILPAPKPQYTVQISPAPNRLNLSRLPPGCNRWISPLWHTSPPSFFKDVQARLSEIDPILAVEIPTIETFGDAEMREHLRREDFEQEAIREIQFRCGHQHVRNGTMRINGSWYVGDICQDCDLMINPFPDYDWKIEEARRREILETKDSMKGS